MLAAAMAVFAWLASNAKRQPVAIDEAWTGMIVVAIVGLLGVAAGLLWRLTRFS